MTFLNDVRFGARTLRQAPGFTLTAIVTLALGIGATTAVFSLADGMLWKPLPLPHVDRLVMALQVSPIDPRQWYADTPADLEDIRRESAAFQSLTEWQDGLANIVGADGEPERVSQYLVAA